jgi:hypothetical protein
VPEEGLRRLDEALPHVKGRARRQRRAELWGVVADAYPYVEGQNADLQPGERLAVWWWRARRRTLRDRQRIATLTLGGGVGGAVALGLLRAVIALIFPGVNSLTQFAMYSYWGFCVAAVTVLGMTLADPLLVQPLFGAAQAARDQGDRKQALLAVGLGTLFAGIGLFVLSFFMGLRLVQAPLVPPLGFLFGFGLGLGLAGPPLVRWPQRRIPSLGHAAMAAAVGALTQFLLDLAGDKGVGITISWPHTFYRANASSLIEEWWPALAQRFPQWPSTLGLVDAGLVGAALVVGMALGVNMAGKLLAQLNKAAQWLKAEDQPAEAGDEVRNEEG